MIYILHYPDCAVYKILSRIDLLVGLIAQLSRNNFLSLDKMHGALDSPKGTTSKQCLLFSSLFSLLFYGGRTKAINSIYLRSVSHSVTIPKMFSLYAQLLICLVFQTRPAYLFILYDFLACELVSSLFIIIKIWLEGRCCSADGKPKC